MSSLEAQILKAMDDSPTDHIVTVEAAQELAAHIAKKLMESWAAPVKRTYTNGKVVFPRQQLGGSRERFRDRERIAMNNLMELGIDNVRATTPHIGTGKHVYSIVPRIGMPDVNVAEEGDTIEIQNGRMIIMDYHGNVTRGWLKLP